MGLDHLLLFVVAGLLLNLTPGPDVLFIVTHALKSGARAGVVAAFGITAGCFVHIFAAAVGISALLAASTAAFTVLKWSAPPTWCGSASGCCARVRRPRWSQAWNHRAPWARPN